MLIILYALFGFIIGVLINRAADNLPPPKRASFLATPRCPNCDAPRDLQEQSGLAHFLLRRGHCHDCQARRAMRAPLVEIITALLFAYLWTRFDSALAVLVYSSFTVILLLITIIDLEHRLILNVVVLPATLLVLILRPLLMLKYPLDLVLRDIVLGALCGYLVVFGIYLFGMLFARVMSRVRRRRIDEVAFGLGDVKLAGLVGALVGFPTIFNALFLTILLGGLTSLVVILIQLLRLRRYSAFMAIPYGPFFTIVAWFLIVKP